MDGEALDKCVQDPGRGWVEVLLERSSAAGHPGVGDVSVGGFPGGQGVQLVGENEVALVAEDVMGDGVRDRLLGSVGIVGGGHSFLELLAGGAGESGKGFVEQLVHPGEVVGHRPEWDVCCLGDLAV